LNEFASSIKIIFEKLREFLDVLDYSFFLSGVIINFLNIIVLMINDYDIGKYIEKNVYIYIIIFIILSYVFGLIAFIVGRWLRSGLFKIKAEENFLNLLKELVRIYKIDKHPNYMNLIDLDNDDTFWLLYSRLWAEIRENKDIEESKILLKKYWTLAAVCDGIVGSGIYVLCILFYYNICDQFNILLIILFIFIIIIVILCSREANRFIKFQAEELFATINYCNKINNFNI
jgi:ABC-type multidrug transport system fused ATPase/permease subunit